MIRRWLDLLLYSLIGAVIFEAALPLGYSLWARHSVPDGYAPWLANWTVLLACGVVGTLPLHFRKGHWRYLLCYPPCWFAVLIAGSVAHVGETVLPIAERPQYAVMDWASWRVIGQVLLAFTIPLVIRALWAAGRKKCPTPLVAQCNPTSGLQLTEDERRVQRWKKLEKWIDIEEPAEDEEDDQFGHKPIAQRIATILLRDGTKQNVALLGPFGSGKSTIVDWVIRRLKASGKTIVPVRVNAWAVPHPEDAPRLVLKAVVDKLEEFIDVQRFRALPKTYQQIIAAEPSGVLQRVLGYVSVSDPFDLLEPLDEVLVALGIHVELFVEDFERTGPGFEVRHFERLLWGMRKMQNLSYVLAFDPERKNLDYIKLCDVIESIPPVSGEHTLQLLATAYQTWSKKVKWPVPLKKNGFHTGLKLDESADLYGKYRRLRDGDHPAYSISELLQSPRQIKHMLRRVNRVWKDLCGEVNLEDLIVVSSLREGDPPTFDYLVKNIDAAREGPQPAQSSATVSGAKANWRNFAASRPKATAIELLVGVLQIRQLCTRPVFLLLQSVGNTVPDYFRRILAEHLADDEVRDQDLLRDIRQWKKDRSGEMLDRLLMSNEEDGYATRWARFSSLLEEPEALEVSRRLVEDWLLTKGTTASVNGSPLPSAYRVWNDRVSAQKKVSWLKDAIILALRLNLRFAEELYEDWASVRTSGIGEAERAEVRRGLFYAARSTYADGGSLLRALLKTPAYTLNCLTDPPTVGEPPDSIDVKRWGWLGPVVLEAAREQPMQVVPQVVIMLCKRGIQLFEGANFKDAAAAYRLDPDRLSWIFGSSARPLLMLLARYDGDEPYSQAGAEEARKLLKNGVMDARPAR